MRFKNLSAAAKLSTARMRVSPRSFRALTKFDPMKPAAPVTTVYTVVLSLDFDVDLTHVRGDERNARSHGAQQLVADGARRCRHVVDRQPFAPEHDRAADRRLRDVGQIDDEHVHRHPTGGAYLLPANQNRRPARGVPRIAIRIAAGDDADAVGTRRGIRAAV